MCVLTGCNSNNSSGNSQSNDYTDEIENVTNDITETENAVAGTAIGTKYGKEITLYLNEKDKPKSSATIKSDSAESAAPME